MKLLEADETVSVRLVEIEYEQGGRIFRRDCIVGDVASLHDVSVLKSKRSEAGCCMSGRRLFLSARTKNGSVEEYEIRSNTVLKGRDVLGTLAAESLAALRTVLSNTDRVEVDPVAELLALPRV